MLPVITPNKYRRFYLNNIITLNLDICVSQFSQQIHEKNTG